MAKTRKRVCRQSGGSTESTRLKAFKAIRSAFREYENIQENPEDYTEHGIPTLHNKNINDNVYNAEETFITSSIVKVFRAQFKKHPGIKPHVVSALQSMKAFDDLADSVTLSESLEIDPEKKDLAFLRSAAEAASRSRSKSRSRSN